MATREKKARSVTADSPTPSLGSAHSGSNSNISTTGSGTATNTTGTTAAEAKGGGSVTSSGGGGGADGGGSLSAPTTPTSSRKGAGGANAGAGGTAANVSSGSVGTTAATGGGSGGSTASSSSSSNVSTTRASLSRLKSKQLLLSDDPAPSEEPLANPEGSSSTAPTTPSRTTRRGGSIARDDLAAVDANALAASPASKDKEDMPLSAVAGTSKDLPKSPVIGARRAAAAAAAAVAESSQKQKTAAGKSATVTNSRKHRVVSLKRTALLKRKGKKIIGKPILGKKVVARRQLAASVVAAGTGKSSAVRGSTTMPMKKEATTTTSPTSTGAKEDASSELLSTPSLRNGKPRNSDSPVAKRKSAGSALKREMTKSPDPQQVKLERRRSCSVSKCSSEDGGGGGGGGSEGTAAGFEFKRELLDDEVRSKMLDKMAEAFNGRKQEVATPGGTLRRSMRQRKSTTRDKDDFVTPRLKGASSMVDIKLELDAAEDGEAEGTAQTAPLTIDTSEAVKPGDPPHSDGAPSASSTEGSVSGGGGVVGVGETSELVEKDPSLSPELISEGVSELSVKECYSEPAFLENNLGIEKDPKLGEIVQGRFRCDKVSDDSGACEEDEDEEEGKMNASGGGGDVDEANAHVQEQSVASVVEELKVEEEEDAEGGVPVVVTVSASVEIVKHEDCELGDIKVEDQMIIDEEDQASEGVDATAEESVVSKLEVDPMEDDEEEDMEVVVELESGKADSDSETISSVVGPSSTVEATVAVKDDDEAVEEEEEEEDVLMIEEPTATGVVGEEEQEVEQEVEVKVEVPTPSSAAESTVVEIIVAEEAADDQKDNKEERKPEALDGGEVKPAAGDDPAVETTPLPDAADKSETTSPSNGGIVPGGEEDQPTVSSNNQQTPRSQKAAAVGSSSPGSSATPKATKSTGATGASSSSTGSSTSSTSSISGKESKSKSRTGKEKSKDDEKTREEKLRQEKLRVEEKVREEKLRAEMRLKEELEQQQKKKEGTIVVLENGTGEDVSAQPMGGSSPSTATGEKVTGGAEKELKTDPAVTALIALPAITITRKDSSSNDSIVAGTPKRKSSRDAVESVGETIKVELEILPIPSETTAPLTPVKEEKSSVEAPLPSVDSVESPLQIISKSEQAAAAVTITLQKAVVDGVADSNKSPVPSSSSSTSLSVIKIESEGDGAGGEASAEGSGEDASKDTSITGGKESKRNGTSTFVAQLPADKASIVVGGTPKDEEPQAASVAGSATSTGTPPPLDETDDVAKQKESHLKHLGLLTIRAACEEMQRRTEQKPPASSTDQLVGDGATLGATGGGGEGWLAAAIGQSGSTSGASGGGRNGNKSTRGSRDEYTVSMKTSAVLGGKGGSGGSGRGEKRKQQRMPLKMTFQKGKGKGSSGGGSGVAVRDSSNGSGTSSSNGSSAAAGSYATDAGNNGQGDTSTFYTIHSNELDHHSSNSSDGHSHRDSSAGGRKAHSRSHTTDGVSLSEAVGETSSTDKAIQKSLVIPEKASSFNVHPERLCQDQCFYCGGKFGLYDTPCHIAAIKSTERQQKILLAESKITLDSCLCDACFRHVDRKANYPSQKKKTSSSGGPQQNSASSGASSSSSGGNAGTNTQTTVSPIVIKMTTNKDGSTSITGQQNHHHQPMVIDDGSGGPGTGKTREICAVRQCTAHALQALRRKWVLKMKRKIGKHLDINLEQAARATTENISICNRHYEQISHLMICAVCTKPLQRNQVYHLYNNIPQLERLMLEQGLAIRLSSSELVVCKLCKHYANLLFKPPDPKSQKAQFITNYNRRLCISRQRETKEQSELQQEQQAIEVQSVEPVAGAPVNDGEAVARRPSTVDIVISDGDEEEQDEEDDEVEVYQQQSSASQQKFQKVSDLFSIGENSVSLRRRGSSRKSPDVSIIEGTSMAEMSDRLGEITIIPTTKTFPSSNHHNQQQQQQQQQRDDNYDMTRVLKSNPNISMRELFPGEEELGVHVAIPFSSSSMRTPEGWTKVTSTIQYDDNTRALWEELQKPYGNQSSFLRHLILLEKYFRNGDLVLSPQAKTNATTYSEAVQNRLRSFDNVPTPPVASPPALASLTSAAATSVSSGQQDKTSHIFQQFSSATITIVPASKARSKAPSSQGTSTGSGNASNSAASSDGASASSVAPVSLLKSNNLRLSVSDKVTVNSLKRKLSNEGKATGGGSAAVAATPSSGSGSSAIVAKVAKLDEPKVSTPSAPPQLISINRKSSATSITAIPTASLSASATAAPASSKQQQQQSLLQSVTQPAQQSQSSQAQAKRSPPSYAASTAGGASTSTTSTTPATIDQRDVIHMPEQLSDTEREETSAKPWRPTLLPIAPGVTESLKYGPLYQTADGRLLPMLVQVMSGGKPYHISIDDYNRMCILRREKLIQQQHNITQSTTTAAAAAAAAASSTAATTVGKRSLPPSRPATTTATSTGTTAASLPPPAHRLSLSAAENSSIGTGSTTSTPSNASTASVSARLVQVPNQILEQNSLIPIAGGSSLGGGSGGSRLDMLRQKQNSSNTSNNSSSSSSLTVTMTTSNNNNNNSLAKTSISATNAVKPLSLPNSTTVYPMVISANTISLPSASGNASSSSLAGGGGNGGNGGSALGLMYSQASSIGRSNPSTSLVLTQQQSSTTSVVSVNSGSGSGSNSISNPLDQLLKGGKHVTQSQLQAFAAAAASSNGGIAGSLLDNSPAQLLSKIPKSLTVIPQQKQRSMSRVSSHEDQHSA